MDALTALKTRRSVKPKELGKGAGPSGDQLKTILEIATRVPDHGKLCPWRIKVLQGEGQKKLGRIAAEQFMKANPDANKANEEFEAARFTRAPIVLAILSTPVESQKAPRWEQEMSAGAVCMNILHACHVMGFGASWLTEWPAFNPTIIKALGGDIETKIAGFVYVGEKIAQPEERERPKLNDVVGIYST